MVTIGERLGQIEGAFQVISGMLERLEAVEKAVGGLLVVRDSSEELQRRVGALEEHRRQEEALPPPRWEVLHANLAQRLSELRERLATLEENPQSPEYVPETEEESLRRWQVARMRVISKLVRPHHGADLRRIADQLEAELDRGGTHGRGCPDE